MGRTVKCSLQSIVAKAFLNIYAELNSLPYPTGRDSMEETPVRWLTSSVTRADVHSEYKSSWKCILDAELYSSSGKNQIPMDSLNKDSFFKVWKQLVLWLKVLKVGSDFYNTFNFIVLFLQLPIKIQNYRCNNPL